MDFTVATKTRYTVEGGDLGQRGDLGRKVGPLEKVKNLEYVQFPASSMSFNDILTTFSFKLTTFWW